MVLVLAIGGTALAAVTGGGIYWYLSREFPNLITAADYRPMVVTQVVTQAEKGKQPVVLAEFSKQRRYLVPYEKIPEKVVKAFLAAEDDKFFEHPGINIVSMIRAGWANFRAGHVVQGGSTITQQVAKSLLLSPEKSFGRKIKEVILASRLERTLTKQQILYLYLNEIYLGHNAYGVEAAARTYFRKSVGELSVAEAAILAGLPQAPSKYSPVSSPQKAKERQRYVLRRMAEIGAINQTEMAQAMAQPLKIYYDENTKLKYSPYWVEHIRRYLVEKYGNDAVYENGLTVTLPTTPALAQAARKSLQAGLEEVEKRIGFRGPEKHLASTEEMEKFLRERRLKMIQKRVGYGLLMADGRIDAVEAMKLAGVTDDTQLIDKDDLYPAVVTQVDDRRKGVSVLIGAVKAEIPQAKLAWARPPGGLPSRLLKRGDVIQVRVTDITGSSVFASLEQKPSVQGALFSMDAQTGAVLAMEGGYDWEDSEFNRATQAQRQPGSSFKPIIFASAIEKGFTPASIVVDSPIVYQDGDQGKWKPSNFEERFYGDTTFRQALIKSRNVPTIKIVQSIQVPYVIEYAKRIGLTGQFAPDLSVSLGSGLVSLMDMTKVYSLFPRLGRRVNPVFLTAVVDRDGKTLEEYKLQEFKPAALVASGKPLPPWPVAGASPAPGASPVALPTYPPADDPDQLMDPRVAYVMTHLMKEVVAFGTGHAAQSLGRAAAGKTGTTNDYIDAWFMGFTPHVVTGVWVGFDNHRSIGPGETGAKAALPIWLSYMREAVKGYPDEDFVVPQGVVFASIDGGTGKLAKPNSSSAIKEAFIEGTQPTETSGNSSVNSESQSEFFKEDIE